MTTAFAPTTEPSPIVTPRTTVDLRTEPYVVADSHPLLGDALVLDRHVQVGVAVVEVGDVHVIGDECAVAYLDVEIAVDGDAARERALVADAQGALVAADCRVDAQMHPASEDQPAEPAPRVELGTAVQEHETQDDHVRVRDSEPQEAPVPHQIPRRVRAIAQDPAQRRDGAGTAHCAGHADAAPCTPNSRSCAPRRSCGVAKTSIAPVSSPGDAYPQPAPRQSMLCERAPSTSCERSPSMST